MGDENSPNDIVIKHLSAMHIIHIQTWHTGSPNANVNVKNILRVSLVLYSSLY